MFQETSQILLVSFGLIFLAFVIGLLLFLSQAKKNRMFFKSEKEFMALTHRKELLTTQLAMQQQTMQEIGREIHDNVGQKLTLASIYAQQLAYENKAPHINGTIEEIGRIVNDSLHDLRTLSKTLTQDGLEAKSLELLINEEAEKIRKTGTCQVETDVHFNGTVIDKLSKQAIIRVVQEFLQNSLKHGRCKKIQVQGKEVDHNIQLHMQDDGIGFNMETIKKNGIGLDNMRKRIQFLNGNFTINSQPGMGTQVSITIPLS